MYVGQLVRDTVCLLGVYHEADKGATEMQKMHNVAPGRCATVCSDHDTSVKLNSHNGGLCTSIRPGSTTSLAQDTYTQIDFARLQLLYVYGVHGECGKQRS